MPPPSVLAPLADLPSHSAAHFANIKKARRSAAVRMPRPYLALSRASDPQSVPTDAAGSILLRGLFQQRARQERAAAAAPGKRARPPADAGGLKRHPRRR